MNTRIVFSGKFEHEGFLDILHRISCDKMNGTLIISSGEKKIHIVVKKGTISFVHALNNGTLSDYLQDQQIIDTADYEKAIAYAKQKDKRFGRSLLELGLIDTDTFWKSVQEHLKETVLSVFRIKSADFEFISQVMFEDENITLDLDIDQLMIEGSRLRDDRNLLEEKLSATETLFPLDYAKLDNLQLKPYEFHVLELIKREKNFSSIIEKSEILRFDTMKLIDLFLIMKIITNNEENIQETELPVPKKVVMEKEKMSGAASFVSFAEALSYYNNKYELIYKVFSKEIGPIALSILQKSIHDISDNLPIYLQKIKWNSNGTIQEDHLLKSLYHRDFKENINIFLKGLEEILYAGIYTIRKNISPEMEKTVLKWINRPVR